MKLKWEPILECRDDDGNDTCWAAEVNSSLYGKYLWIDMKSIGEYFVTFDTGNGFMPIVKCKSLASAKRWVSMNLV